MLLELSIFKIASLLSIFDDYGYHSKKYENTIYLRNENADITYALTYKNNQVSLYRATDGAMGLILLKTILDVFLDNDNDLLEEFLFFILTLQTGFELEINEYFDSKINNIKRKVRI